MTTSLIVGTLLVGFHAPVPSAEDWPRFRGPDGSNRTQETGLPLTWSERENVVWKTKLPGYGASSPITLGDRIFLTAYSGYGEGEPGPDKAGLRQHVICLDRKSGKVVWNKHTQGNPKERDYGGYIALHGYSSGSAVTDGETVYAFFGSSGVVAYSLTGEPLWTAQVGSETHQWGSGSSPIVYDNLLIVNASVESASLIGLNRKTGKEVWRAGDVIQSYSTPIIIDGTGGQKELVLHSRRRLSGFNPSTGKELWRYDPEVDHYICPSVVAHEGIIYAICARTNKFVAVRSGGRGDVTKTHTVWASEGWSNVPSPVYHKGYLYWLSDRGIANCVEARTGKRVYKERVPDSGKVYASFLLAEGRLYAVSRENGTFVLAASPEFKQLAHNVIANDDSIFNASPVASRGQLLLRSDKYLYCIGE